ncbi:M4 family metallopeptidase [Prolixibacter sp. SD074]|uniref:M4 family metallopeptidase n=1 Tax=Prolixibacter sp. SD074 TaxID=2652391 RepID=UPI001283AC05|nr:M4 family metallopeptidase [Prolixibacter sp. SD074]GET28920.1 hypothetical protein SD074_11220 [Prolixibacter sp. SD074]
MVYAHGNFVAIDDMDIAPILTSIDARNAFADYKNIPIDSIVNFQSELLIREFSYGNSDSSSIPKLVYKVTIDAECIVNNEIGYIDANSGKVLATIPRMTGISYVGTFSTRYSGTQTAKTMLGSGKYRLEDDSRAAPIHTKNLNNSTNITNAAEIYDYNNIWTSSEHSPNNIDMGLDVHWALQEIYDYFYDNYEISSFNDNSFDINAFIRWGNDPDDRDNAKWDPTYNRLLFGEGYTYLNPIASLDAVAHEYGHGISDMQADIPYDDVPSAAIQEGLSDIWSVILENAIEPVNIWQIGDQVVKSGSCMRNNANPTDALAKYQLSVTYGSPSFNNTTSQYIKSGVFSYWFYLLVNGGSGTNEIGDSYSVYGIGMDEAEEFITNSIYDEYLDNLSSFSDFKSAFSNAAMVYYGDSSFIKNQVDMAFYAVGLSTEPNPLNYDITGANLLCTSSNETYTLNGDVPSNATVNWTSSSNINIISSSNTSAICSGNGYGSSWLRATVTINGNSFSVTNYDIGVGPPSILDVTSTNNLSYDYISDSYKILAGSGDYKYEGKLVVDEYYGLATNYHWAKVLGSTLIPINWSASYNTVYVYTKAADRILMLSCTASNACGSYTKNYSFFTGDASPFFALYPNPASNTVEIEVIGLTNSVNNNNEYEVELIDNTMQIRKKIKMKSNKTTINISGLKKGIYFVLLKSGH